MVSDEKGEEEMKCPKCNIDMKIVKTMKGHYLQCPRYWKCGEMDDKFIKKSEVIT